MQGQTDTYQIYKSITFETMIWGLAHKVKEIEFCNL